MAVEGTISKALKQPNFKIRRSGNSSSSLIGSSAWSEITCHKCGKKGHIQKYCRSKANGSSGNTPKNPINDLPEWATRKNVVSDIKDMTTATMNRNNKKYKWCTYFNNGQGAWGFHWKDGDAK